MLVYTIQVHKENDNSIGHVRLFTKWENCLEEFNNLAHKYYGIICHKVLEYEDAINEKCSLDHNVHGKFKVMLPEGILICKILAAELKNMS